jgi:predicted ribosome quality control (RQC) complex YloA/Tae2 family protein
MNNKYNDFNIVLKDFIRNVILNQSDDLDAIFKKEILKIKLKSKKCLKKLLRVGNNFISENLCDGYSFDDSNFEEYIKNDNI